MRRTRFDDAPCPIARTTDLIGDWWTPLIMREAFSGRRRFDEFQQALGVPRAVLAQPLQRAGAPTRQLRAGAGVRRLTDLARQRSPRSNSS